MTRADLEKLFVIEGAFHPGSLTHQSYQYKQCEFIKVEVDFDRAQNAADAQAFIEGDRLQLIHDPSTGLHHAVPVPQQLPQIPVFPARHPDLRETIFEQQTQD